MRAIITRTLPVLSPPDAALLAEARAAAEAGRHEDHPRFLQAFEALHALEQAAPQRPLNVLQRITVAAFNAERLTNPAATRRLRDQTGAAIALFTEIDVGMARSGNRHGPRALAESSGEGYLYGVEFVELDLGDADEMRRHAGGGTL